MRYCGWKDERVEGFRLDPFVLEQSCTNANTTSPRAKCCSNRLQVCILWRAASTCGRAAHLHGCVTAGQCGGTSTWEPHLLW